MRNFIFFIDVELSVELPVIYDSLVFMWHQCDVNCLTLQDMICVINNSSTGIVHISHPNPHIKLPAYAIEPTEALHFET